jgi:hypothetical protein
MLDVLTLRRLSYGLAGLLALAALALSVVSLKLENPDGLFPIVLIISAVSLLVVLFATYLQVQPVVTGEY